MSKWMILTPGRSGSTFIAESISHENIRPFGDTLSLVNSLDDINFNIDYIKNLNFQSGSVWHSHNLNSLNFVDSDTKLIISTRSLKEIIDDSGLYPLTCLSSLTQEEKKALLEKGLVLVREICSTSLRFATNTFLNFR